MRREVHVRCCEGLGVRLPGPTLLIMLHEPGLRRALKSYFDYYAHWRTHLSLDKDALIPRPVQPSGLGRVVELPEVGGLHPPIRTPRSLTEPARSAVCFHLTAPAREQ
jgi:hypothetical protein